MRHSKPVSLFLYDIFFIIVKYSSDSFNQYFNARLFFTLNGFLRPLRLSFIENLIYIFISIPVITGRFRNVFKTFFVCYECLKDISETACAHWDVFLKIFVVLFWQFTVYQSEFPTQSHLYSFYLLHYNHCDGEYSNY